jgi:hypothetical protein
VTQSSNDKISSFEPVTGLYEFDAPAKIAIGAKVTAG